MIDRTPEITFSLTFVSSMSELLKRMILNGDGVGWLPQYSIQRELDEGRLTILDEACRCRSAPGSTAPARGLTRPPNVSGSTLKPVTNRGNNPLSR
ncbi:LysR family transcriptional regulator [Klebsiella pneumoniae]|uniref:LysR family transcriptional regulator n=1 Tax=Klebsiella pneumoniae TaxID=573 RepID=A0A378FXT9_KLEPN|nr:LysR family transcriptional regulator [Klebsiella pneumoniae]